MMLGFWWRLLTASSQGDKVMQAKKEIAGFASGFALPLEAAKFLFGRARLWTWAVAPLVVNVLLYVAVIALAVWLINSWQIEDPADAVERGWLMGVFYQSFDVLKWVIAIPLILALCYFTFTMVGMVVASPLNDMLSERTERLILEEKETGEIGWRLSAATMVLSMWDALMIVLRQIGWSIVALPFLAVPILGVVPMLAVNAYFTGRGFVDISTARSYLRLRHSSVVLKQRRMQVFGLGSAMLLLFMIPFVGLVMLPIGVVAGTLMYCRIDWRAELEEAGVDMPEGYRRLKSLE